MNIVEKYQKQYDEATERLKKIGIEIGWMRDSEDNNDVEELFEPLLSRMSGTTSDTEQYKIEQNLDAFKSMEFLKVYDEWEKAKKQLDMVRKNI